MFATKISEKVPDPLNAKEHYQSFLRKKDIKSEKHSEIITQQAKSFEHPNIVDIKSVIIEHQKTSITYPRLTDRLKSFPNRF